LGRALSKAVREDTLFIRDALRDAEKLRRHDIIMKYLSPIDFFVQLHDIISQQQPGTGQWFLDSDEFRSLVRGDIKTLFCPGIPGAGKTVMASISIDHLNTMARCEDVAIAHIFCNYKSKAQQTIVDLFASLLKQLLRDQPDLTASVWVFTVNLRMIG